MNYRCNSSLRRVVASVAVLPVFVLAAFAGGSGGAGASAANSMGPMDLPGVTLKNFGVVDGRIYRGEQPRDEEFRELKGIGVGTIIDLRLDAKRDSRASAEAAGLKYVNIPIDDGKQPTDADVAAFLKVLDETADSKVYVHCAGGRHRTGSMLAVYRMVRKGWTVDQAYDEMLAYDFYTKWGHKGFKTYVFDYWTRMKSDPSSVPAAYCAPSAEPGVAAAAAVTGNVSE